jgi:hypothetical protein
MLVPVLVPSGQLANQSFGNVPVGSPWHAGYAEVAPTDMPGIYVTCSTKTIVGTAASLQVSSDLVSLEIGTEVEVLEVVDMVSEGRIRAKIKEPHGWITLVTTWNGRRWAERKLLVGHAPPVTLLGMEEWVTRMRSTVGEWQQSLDFECQSMRCYSRGLSTLFEWTIESGTLQRSDKYKVSHVFQYCDSLVTAPPFFLKMMLTPIEKNGSPSSFKKAGGRGIVQVKCDSTSHRPIIFFLSASNGRTPYDAYARRKRGPEVHHFSKSGVCGLSTNNVWEFQNFVDHDAATFTVYLEVMTAPICHQCGNPQLRNFCTCPQ